MKTMILCGLIGALLTVPSPAARKKDRPWPPFQVGVTGIMAAPAEDTVIPLTVAEVTPDTPAAGKLQVGDVLVAVNGVKLEAPDPRPVLGNAITAAEAGNGKLTFSVERAGKPVQATVMIPVVGAYSATWPIDCPKTNRIVAAAAARSMELIDPGKDADLNRTTAMHCMFLLSTGKDEHLAAVGKLMRASVPGMDKVSGHTWNNSYMLIAMGEYYLRTGDKVVLPPMRKIVDDSFERDCVGGWGHWDYLNPSYTRSGLVNAAGAPLFVGIVLARECGVAMKDADFEKSLRYFYRFAGYGGVPYGDQGPDSGGSTNGKSGMLGVALSLLNEPYAGASRLLAVEQADSYDDFEGGHTGNFTNVMWRALSAPGVPENMRQHYRRHQDKLRWYFELCRQPNGGFRMLPAMLKEPRYANEEFGMAVALNYTGGWRKLRITGAPPTRFSVIKPVRDVFSKNPDFLKMGFAEGCKEADFAAELEAISRMLPWNARSPFQTRQSKQAGQAAKAKPGPTLPPVDEIARHFRHWNPQVRCQAACAIGYHGDKALPAIEKAIHSSDARVRQAGLRGLSGYLTFFMMRSPFTYSAEGFERMVPWVVEVLKNPRSDISEIDAALYAMGAAPKKCIVEHLGLIASFLKHDEWWLRSSAFMAICETGADAAPVVPDLIGCFVREQHGWPRELYRRLLTKLLREDRPKLTSTVRGQLVELLGDDIVGGKFSRDHAYTMRASFFYEQRNCHVLMSLEPDNLVLVSDQLNQMLANFGDPELAEGKKGSNALVILNGEDADEPGLLDRIARMNDDHRAKFMPGLKALLVGGLDVMCNGKTKQTTADPTLLKEVKDKAKAMVDAYEKDHPAVQPYPAKVIDYDGSQAG
jgi:hypothetical protein